MFFVICKWLNKISFHILTLPKIGIHEVYKSLFLEIINGKFSKTYYKHSEISNHELGQEYQVNIDSDDALENLDKAIKLNSGLLGIKIEYVPLEMHDLFSIRYAGHNLNLEHGVLPENVNRVNILSKNLITTMKVANNTSFGEVLQMPAYAGSTVIPYLSEIIDIKALDVIRKLINDIKDEKIDKDFMHNTDNQYAELYKNFYLSLSDVRKIPDISQFQIIINGQEFSISNFDYLKDAKQHVYDVPVKGFGKIRFSKPYKNSHLYSLTIEDEKNHHDLILRYSKHDDSFQRFQNIANKPFGTKVQYIGTTESEAKIYLQDLAVVREQVTEE